MKKPVANLPARYRSATRPPPKRRAARVSAAPDRGEPFVARDGRALRLRPIRPADAPALQRAFARLTPEQVRARFFYRMNELGDELAQRLSDVDPEQVIALVVTDDDDAEIRGEARAHLDAVTETCEFALAIDPAFVGVGVGRALMTRLADDARRHGMVELWGDVLAGNHAMLQFVRRLGLECTIEPGFESGVVRARLTLLPTASRAPTTSNAAKKRGVPPSVAAAPKPRVKRGGRAAKTSKPAR